MPGSVHPRPAPSRIALFALLAVGFAAGIADAAQFRVGSGGAAAGCTHDSLAAAIEAARQPGEHSIRVSRGSSDSHQALLIRRQNLSIVGGYDDCADDTVGAGERTQVSCAGIDSCSVISIEGPANVMLSNLVVSDGNAVTGGGIAFKTGDGVQPGGNSLTLQHVDIERNRAQDGGGIAFHAAPGTPAQLHLLDDVSFLQNEARRWGGALRLSGDARLHATGARLRFNGNRAERGGAIEVMQPADASIAPLEDSGQPTFLGNSATRGGALAVIAPDAEAGVSRVQLHGRGGRSLTFRGNQAFAEETSGIGGDGGMLYAEGAEETAAHTASICLQHVAVERGAATNGTVAWLHGAHFGRCAPLLAPTCRSAQACDRFASNHADQPAGAQLVVGGGSRLAIHDTLVVGNGYYGALIRSVESTSRPNQVQIVNTDFARNQQYSGLANGSLLSLSPDTTLDAEHVTVAGNVDNGGPGVFVRRRGLQPQATDIRRSIVFQPALALVAFDAGVAPVAGVDDVLLRQRDAWMTDAHRTLVADDAGLDPASHQLQAHSPALDVASADDAQPWDRLGNPRPFDVAAVPDVRGPIDLGAYERQDAIFRDGMEPF